MVSALTNALLKGKFMKVMIIGFIVCSWLTMAVPCMSSQLPEDKVGVYSVVLNYYLNNEDPKHVVISSRTAPLEQFYRSIYPNLPHGSDQLLQRMISTDETPEPIPTTLSSSYHYNLISMNQIRSLRFAERNLIHKIKRTFPKADVAVLLSRIGFNDSGDSAMVLIEMTYIEKKGLCETYGFHGRTYLLNKVNANWVIVSVAMAWDT